MAYRDQAGHIHEARPTASTRAKSEDWETLDLTQQTDAPLATTDPVGLVSKSTNDRYYSFIDHRGKTHVLHFDGRWHHQAIDDPVQD